MIKTLLVTEAVGGFLKDIYVLKGVKPFQIIDVIHKLRHIASQSDGQTTVDYVEVNDLSPPIVAISVDRQEVGAQNEPCGGSFYVPQIEAMQHGGMEKAQLVLEFPKQDGEKNGGRLVGEFELSCGRFETTRLWVRLARTLEACGYFRLKLKRRWVETNGNRKLVVTIQILG